MPYYLNEDKDWDLSGTELQRSLKEARGKGIEVKGISL